MVARNTVRLVPVSYLTGASCPLPERAGPLLHGLSPAERLVVAHVAQGLSNKEIASALGKAEPTVKHQLASGMRKLDVQSRGQLIILLLTGTPPRRYVPGRRED